MSKPDEEEDLSIPSIMTVCKDCKLGHCSCYYTNQNKCCRCKETHIDRVLIHRDVKYGDSRDGVSPERAPIKRGLL